MGEAESLQNLKKVAGQLLPVLLSGARDRALLPSFPQASFPARQRGVGSAVPSQGDLEPFVSLDLDFSLCN